MPEIRVETRPTFDLGAGALNFGPWPHDILVRGLQFLINVQAAAQDKIASVGTGLFGVNHFLEVYPSGPDVCLLNTGAAMTVLCSAVPGGGASQVRVDNQTVASSRPFWQFSIPYNWIIPQRGVVYVSLMSAAVGDTIQQATLWYEKAGEARDKPKRPIPPDQLEKAKRRAG
jgi:hypothetical protein